MQVRRPIVILINLNVITNSHYSNYLSSTQRSTSEFMLDHLSPNSTYTICCGFAVQQLVQQIHNKSYKWSLGFSLRLFAEFGKLKRSFLNVTIFLSTSGYSDYIL